ncbi:MAG: hypothetical protein ACRCUY_08485 [Thermoguttaceae bacterium]
MPGLVLFGFISAMDTLIVTFLLALAPFLLALAPFLLAVVAFSLFEDWLPSVMRSLGQFTKGVMEKGIRGQISAMASKWYSAFNKRVTAKGIREQISAMASKWYSAFNKRVTATRLNYGLVNLAALLFIGVVVAWVIGGCIDRQERHENNLRYIELIEQVDKGRQAVEKMRQK